ncbi:hypothetical protein [Rhodococcus sp. USK10]|uniref:hypothetical protein n=1 Tax=Rhodococcus sp. USK10 TaxID=2789739 RepID=UPI0027E52E2A|nr:hypothetical protein [Rhodococcus sp. USK10]
MFFGSTILDTGAHHTLLSRALNNLYNGPITLFHNRGDDLDCLHAALAAAFEEVEITVVDAVAVFADHRPRSPGQLIRLAGTPGRTCEAGANTHPAAPDPRTPPVNERNPKCRHPKLTTRRSSV